MSSSEYKKRQEQIKRLADFDADQVMEGREGQPGFTSYTINKSSMIMCLRNDKRIIDTNTLIYVMTHELAHIAEKSYGHKASFWQTFKWLIGEAADFGLYEPIDYSEEPIEFCGMDINNSVLY